MIKSWTCGWTSATPKTDQPRYWAAVDNDGGDRYDIVTIHDRQGKITGLQLRRLVAATEEVQIIKTLTGHPVPLLGLEHLQQVAGMLAE